MAQKKYSNKQGYNTATRRNEYKKAASTISRAAKKLSPKQKKAAGIAIAVIVLIVVVFGILLVTGVIDEQKLKVKLGLADEPATDASTSVHFVDVGQGDCTLIVSDGKAVLIDAGEVEYGDDVVKYLKAQNVKKLDYVIVSHQHTDHMGGMSAVIENFEIGELIMPPIPDELFPTNSTYDRYLSTLEKYGTNVSEAVNKSTLTVGSVKLTMYVQDPNAGYDDLNNFSIAVKATHGDNSFIFAGDAEFDEEDMLAKSGYDLSAKVMKVNHHGSGGSSGNNFLGAVKPKYAVISVGANNDYGHPKQAAISRIEKYCGENIFRTDECGSIVFESDGNGLNIVLEKKAGNG